MALSWIATSGTGDSVGDANSVNVGVAGTPAAGDFLVIHVLNQRAEDTWATPSGWTIISSQRNGAAAFYKIAAGGEGSVTVTKTGTTGRCLGYMMLFRGEAGATLSLDVSNSDTDLTVSTITPTKSGTVWCWLAGRSDDVSAFSAYAMTTDDPTWTERYDFDPVSQCTIAGATSSVRSQVTATGNLTATGLGGNSAIVFAIAQVATASPAAATLSITAAQPASSITTSSNVPVVAVAITSAIPTPTPTTQQYPVFVNTTKNTAAATDTSKNAATATNTSKNSASATNTDKTG